MADKFLQGVSVNPFHYDAASDQRVLDFGEILADVVMAEGKTYVELFIEQIFVYVISAIFFLERLIDKESSVFADTIQTIEPF